MKFRILRSLFKKLRHGLTLMIVPRSSYQKTRYWHIPFPLVLIILSVIIFNIYIFMAYSTQICLIVRFQHYISQQKETIAKFHAEKPRIKSTLDKDQLVKSEMAALLKTSSELANTWKRVRQKGSIKVLTASRNSSKILNSNPFYKLTPILEKNGEPSSLEELDHNLAEIDDIIKKETEKQTTLLQELQAYERKLDHTPSIWPVYSSIVCRFGMRFHPVWKKYQMHDGVDLRADYGTKVRATADGVVSYSAWDAGYGYLVKINHDYGYETRYGHNSRLLVHTGQAVKKGQIISLSGSTGVSTGPHLHYEVRINERPVNPASYFKN